MTDAELAAYEIVGATAHDYPPDAHGSRCRCHHYEALVAEVRRLREMLDTRQPDCVQQREADGSARQCACCDRWEAAR